MRDGVFPDLKACWLVGKRKRLLFKRAGNRSVFDSSPSPVFSVQEEPILRILNDPLKALLKIETSHGRARENAPFVGEDAVQL